MLTAGGQFSTKMYIADSKRDCIAPTSMILGSDLTTFTASRMVGLLLLESSELLLLATFSFHSIEESNPPKIRKPTETSKGPVEPLCEAAKPAIWPAKMATIESPAYAYEKRCYGIIQTFEKTIPGKD